MSSFITTERLHGTIWTFADRFHNLRVKHQMCKGYLMHTVYRKSIENQKKYKISLQKKEVSKLKAKRKS